MEEVCEERKRMGRREVLCPLIAARHNLFLSQPPATHSQEIQLRNTVEKYR